MQNTLGKAGGNTVSESNPQLENCQEQTSDTTCRCDRKRKSDCCRYLDEGGVAVLTPGGKYLQWGISVEILFTGCKFWGIYLALKRGFVLYCVHRLMLDNISV